MGAKVRVPWPAPRAATRISQAACGSCVTPLPILPCRPEAQAGAVAGADALSGESSAGPRDARGGRGHRLPPHPLGEAAMRFVVWERDRGWGASARA